MWFIGIAHTAGNQSGARVAEGKAVLILRYTFSAFSVPHPGITLKLMDASKT